MSTLHRIVIASVLVTWSAAATPPPSKAVAMPPQSTDRAIVEFREPLRVASLGERAVVRTLQADLDRISREGRVRRVYTRAFNGAAVTIPRRSWEAVAKLPYVKRVHPDLPVRAFLSRSVPQVGAPQLWTARGTRGKGAVIAVLDTGIDYRHPALGGGLGSGFKVAGGWDFINDDADPMDDHGHGTHVAGIAAASSAALTGVAPDATLLAYKVLDAAGSGIFSDIVAAIDRALDPDGNGDPSDAVDVINLSLGGPGFPDDPVSSAVEKAIAAGVVVVCAAGNAGDFFSIGSPASAPHAITVGNAELDGTLSPFTSKGPNTQLYTIKPEVVAPGEGIVSTWPGGGTHALSGTSMAAPHVAGAAALLRVIHPDWTPADVKSALVSTAFDLQQEVMAQGAGRIDVAQAANATVFLDPATIGFGLADVERDVWSPSLQVRITNRGSSAIALAEPVAGAGSPAAPQWTMTAAAASLAPGESREVTLAMTIDHRDSPYPTAGSLSYGSTLELAGARTKWAFVKASRIRIRTDEGTPAAFVSDERQRFRTASVGPNVAESILPAGTYDVLTWIPFADEARLAVHEQLEVRGLADVAIATSSLRHELTPAAVDETGVRLSARERIENVSTYQNRLRLVYPDANAYSYFDSAFVQAARIRTNDIPASWKLFVGEFYASSAARTTYGVQHPLLEGVRESATLQGAPVREQQVRVVVPPRPNERHSVALGSTTDERQRYGVELEPTVHAMSDAPASPWSGRVFLTPDVDVLWGFAPSVGLRTQHEHLPDFGGTPLRLAADGRVAVIRGLEAGPATQWHRPGSVLTLGGAPVHPRLELSPLSPTLLHLHFFFWGANGERRWRDITSTRWAAFDAAGASIGSGAMDSSNLMIPLPSAGPVRIELTNDRYSVAGRSGLATFRSWVDTTRTDATAPSLTALTVQSAHGAQLDPVPIGTDAWVLFGVIDRQWLPGPHFASVATGATRVEYRVSGSTAWIAAPPQLVAEDILPPGAGRTSDGAVYRCRIPASLAETTIDLRITAEDPAGNRSEYTLEPAFAVSGESAGSGRRRVVRP